MMLVTKNPKERYQHKDSLEQFDDFCLQKSHQNDQFYLMTEFASLGGKNWQYLTIFGNENLAEMAISGNDFMAPLH